MTPHIPENFSTWLVEWSPVGITGNALPPRDPNDDDDDDEDEEDEEDEEPAVVREPDDDSEEKHEPARIGVLNTSQTI